MKNNTRFRNKRSSLWLISSLFFLILLGSFSQANAQYFGQNKVRYKNLKFKVYQTPHFEIYYYLRNDSLVKRFAQESEVWYDLHQQVFRDTFSKKNPIILYNNSADFQQTTALQGEIGVGTGGVTEGMKNRVILPVTQLNHQTRHVLGHELVHAFQYHSLIEGDSTNLENIGNLPLWMVEGMAEYLSVGKVDAYTAMWMRDAYLNKNIPTLRDLTSSNKYFPYRYGQAFWAYIGSTYGDTVIVPYFRQTARYGYEIATKKTFGYDEKTLSNLWKTSIENAYKPYLKDTAQIPVGKRIVDEKNGGERYNIAPAISPDGKYVAFLSEKDLLSIDLFLADAKTGKIIRTLASKARNSHIDEFNFIESSGAWSPDSKKFAVGVFSEGRIKMIIIDVENGRTLKTISMGKVEEFSNLTWSPNGEDIAFTGLKEGQSDLYSYSLTTRNITQLTNDKYSDYQANYSNDGSKIVFSSDRTTLDQSAKNVDITFNLAILDLKTKSVTNINVFNGANNLNPQFSANNQNIYFLSNRDGFRNLYRYSIAGGTVEQLTNYFTGISGITEFSPALSLSKNDEILYSYYRAQKYSLYTAKPSDFTPKQIDNQSLNFDAANLPPPQSVGVDIINANLNNFERFEKIPTDSIRSIAYRPKFKLDYLSNTGVGGSVGGRYGSGLSGGIQGVFSDILGRNQIYATAAVNGEIYDFGGQVAYINQKSRVDWGAGISHIPSITAYRSPGLDTISGEIVFRNSIDIIRTFEEKIMAFASYPLSKVHRFELGTSASKYTYRIDRRSQYYDANGLYIGQERKVISLEKANKFYNEQYGYNFRSFSIFGVDAALVGDNSFSGGTSPLRGFRYRLGINKLFGDFNFGSLNADLRKYVQLKPITLAGRIYSSTSFGRDQDQYFTQQFIGYPTLIRGYEYNSFTKHGGINAEGFNLYQLVGSKVAVANFEVRLPFTGPKRIAAIESKFLLSDLNLFFDAGLAYNSTSKVAFKSKPGITSSQIIPRDPNDPNSIDRIENIYERVPAMSAGVSLRVNVFGYFILEPYYAIPFQRTDVPTGVFGLTFSPGW